MFLTDGGRARRFTSLPILEDSFVLAWIEMVLSLLRSVNSIMGERRWA